MKERDMARLRHSPIHEALALMHQPFEHVGCSQAEPVALLSLHPAHALASQTLNFPSPCGVQVRENPRLYGKEVEIKVDNTVLMVRWEEERERWKLWNGESAGWQHCVQRRHPCTSFLNTCMYIIYLINTDCYPIALILACSYHLITWWPNLFTIPHHVQWIWSLSNIRVWFTSIPLHTKGVLGIQAMTRGRGGEGGVSECLKKFSNDFCKMYF